MCTYVQVKNAFSYFYPKRKVLEDGVSTIPLDIYCVNSQYTFSKPCCVSLSGGPVYQDTRDKISKKQDTCTSLLIYITTAKMYHE